jgi:hypothetical protein
MKMEVPIELQAFQDALHKYNTGLKVVVENPTRSPYVAFQRPNLMWVVCHFESNKAISQPALHAEYIASQIKMFCYEQENR